MSERAAAEVTAAWRRRHPNAAPDNESICACVNDGFVCTREQGHDDQHEAHGTFGTIAHAWAQASADTANAAACG